MNDVLIVKLVSGEELLAEVDTETDNNAWVLVNPLMVIPSADEGGRMNLGMMQYMPYTEGPLVVSKAAIAIFANPQANLLAQYNQQFGRIHIEDKKIFTGQ